MGNLFSQNSEVNDVTYTLRFILHKYKLTINDAARAVGISRTSLSHVLNGHSRLTPNLALRFEKAFGDLTMEELMEKQFTVDIRKMRSLEDSIKVNPYKP